MKGGAHPGEDGPARYAAMYGKLDELRPPAGKGVGWRSCSSAAVGAFASPSPWRTELRQQYEAKR